MRLTTHAAHRLVREDGQFGLIAACAAGGQVSLLQIFFLSAEIVYFSGESIFKIFIHFAGCWNDRRKTSGCYSFVILFILLIIICFKIFSNPFSDVVSMYYITIF